MSELKRIRAEIVEVQEKITNANEPLSFFAAQLFGNKEDNIAHLKSRLDGLKTRENFILDNRNGWTQKIIWNVIVPIMTTIATVYVLGKLGLKSSTF